MTKTTPETATQEQIQQMAKPPRDYDMVRILVVGALIGWGIGDIVSSLTQPLPIAAWARIVIALVSMLAVFGAAWFPLIDRITDGKAAIREQKKHRAHKMSELTSAVHMGQLVGKTDESGTTRYTSW